MVDIFTDFPLEIPWPSQIKDLCVSLSILITCLS